MNEEKEVKILFAGDFSPCRGFESIVLEKKTDILGGALPIINNSDISFVNLECPLTTSKKKINKSGPALKAHPKCAEALRPFSVVGLANNHILDYGESGLSDTLEACNSAGLTTVGAGKTLAHAQEYFIKKVKGLSVAVIAISEHEFNQSEGDGAGAAPIDLIDNFKQINNARSAADIVIVTIHGGNEHFQYPRPGLRKLCKHFIDLGVDAVVCHHPHVPGAYEYYRDKPIVYSLGNLIFDCSNPPEDWDLGYMVQLTICGSSRVLKSLDIIPYRQSVELGGVTILVGEEKQMVLDRVDRYKKKLENEDLWLGEWHAFVKRQTSIYIVRNTLPFSFLGLGFLARNMPIEKILSNKRNGMLKLNLLRCESHLELLTAITESLSMPRDE